MASEPMRGIFPILVTPFDEQDRVDEESLRSVVDYTIGAGVHGVGVALGSEIYKLTDAEREQVVRIVIEQVAGRVPVVINTGAQATYPAVLQSQQAEAQGATAVMVSPPTLGGTESEIRSYFKAISNAISIPIFVQDTSNTPVSAGTLKRISEESEHVRYAKIESVHQPRKVDDAVRQCGQTVTIFGGAGGQYLLEELRRGSVGTMPWPDLPHAFVRVWDLYQAGDHDRARAVMDREIAPVTRVSAGGLRVGHTVHKEILLRKGVIRCARVRGPADPLDEHTARELDEICEKLGI